MNATVLLAQLAGSTPQTSSAPPSNVKLEKPQNGAAVTVNLSGQTQLDFSDVASEKLTFVRVGDKLIVLFDNQSTVTIEPVFGPDGHTLANLAFEMAPDRTLTGDQFASTFPITTDQSILPAAGGGSGPTAGAHFSDPTVDPLSIGTPLDLLGAEGSGGTFGAVTEQGANTAPVADAIPLVILNEDGLPGGNPGGPGDVGTLATTFTGPLDINFGTAPIGRSVSFETAQPGLNGLSSDGQVVHFTIATVGGLPTLIGFVGTDPTIIANEVFTVSLNATGGPEGTFTVTLLRPFDDPTIGTEDNVILTIGVIGTNGAGQTTTTTLSIEVNDDSPIINVADESHSVITDVVPGSVVTATGSLGISWGADNFNDHVNGGVSATTGQAGDRAVIFSDAIVAATGDVSGTATAIATLTSDGQAVHYVLLNNGVDLVAYTGSVAPTTFPTDATSAAAEHVIFTVSLSDASNTGSYVLSQYEPLDHNTGTTLFDSIDLSFHFTATDSDGDPVSGTLTATVTDTGPTVVEANITGSPLTDPEALAHATSTTSGTLGISWGSDNFNAVVDGGVTAPDGDRAVIFSNAIVTTTGTVSGGDNPVVTSFTGLTSENQIVHYVLLDNNTVLVAYTGDTAPTTVPGSGPAPSLDGPHEELAIKVPSNIVFVASLTDDSATGGYTVTQYAPLDHVADGTKFDAINLTFNFTAIDSDGDAATGTLTVTVDDTVPTAPNLVFDQPVSEQALPDGNHVAGDTLIATDSLGINWGSDDEIVTSVGGFGRTLSFLAANDSTVTADGSTAVTSLAMTIQGEQGGALTSGGVGLVYVVSSDANGGETLTAHQGSTTGTVIFTLALDPTASNGSYTFTLNGPLDNAAGSSSIALTFTVQATDADGDAVQQHFTVDVQDDVPVIAGPVTAQGVSEQALPDGNHVTGDTLIATNSLGINWGADDAIVTSADSTGRTLSFLTTGNTAIGGGSGTVSDLNITVTGQATENGGALSSQGVALQYVVTALANGGEMLTAYNSNTHNAGTTIFTLTLDPTSSNGSYTFDLKGPLDDAPGSSSIGLTFTVLATDDDGDSVPQSFTVNVQDDVPIAGLGATKTVEEADLLWGTTPDLKDLTVTGSLNVSWGADNNDSGFTNNRSVSFQSSSASADVQVTDSAGDKIVLTSDGHTVQFGIFDGVLVGYINNDPLFEKVFIVSLNDNGSGSYTFTLLGNLDHPAGLSNNTLNLTFDFTATDADGDTSSNAFTVAVIDDVPTVTAIATHTVGEEGLAGANVIKGDAHNASTGFVSLNIDWGADNNNPTSGGSSDDRSVAFAKGTTDALTALGLTSNGVALTYTITHDLIGDLLTATAGSHTVFTVQLSDFANGSYNFTLLDNIDHPAGLGANLDTLTFNVVATDSDGDTVPQSFAVSVQDDIPVISGNVAAQGVSEDALSDGNHITGDITAVTATASLGIHWGADNAIVTSVGGFGRTLAFLDGSDSAIAGGTAVSTLAMSITGSEHATSLSSGGVALQYVVTALANGGEMLTAYNSNTHNAGTTIFTLTLDPTSSNGSYTFDLKGPLDDAPGSSSIGLTFTVLATDDDGDSVPQSFTVNVQDDVPIAGLGATKTVEEADLLWGTTPDLKDLTVTGSLNVSWGADNNDTGFTNNRSVSFQSSSASADVQVTDSAGDKIVLTSDGHTVQFGIFDGVLVGYINNDPLFEKVFIVSLNDNGSGSYTFTLLGNLDHPAGLSNNTLNLTFDFTATDADGDTSSNAFTVAVIDDVPTVTAIATHTVGEEGLAGANVIKGDAHNASTGFVSLNIDWGADNNNPTSGGSSDDRSVAFAKGTTDALTALGLTSNGVALTYTITHDLIGDLLTATAGSHTVFTVQLSDFANGSYNFTLLDNIDHPAGLGANLDTLTFNVMATDSDGDTVPQSFAVSVQDDIPVISGTVATQTVYEGGLPGGNASGEPTTVTAKGTPEALNIDWGADNATVTASDSTGRTLSFLTTGNTAIGGSTGTVTDLNVTVTGQGTENGGALSSQGVALQYVVTALPNGGEMLTAYNSDTHNAGTTIFTLALDPTQPHGGYVFTLLGSLDDASGSDTIGLTFNVQAADADGDPVNTKFTVNVQDDVPIAQVGAAETVSEANLLQGTSPNAAALAATGSLNIEWGADNGNATSHGGDGDRSVAFTNATVAVTDVNGNAVIGLTSHGDPVEFAVLSTGVLVAYTGSTPSSATASNVVFSVALSDGSNGSYTFTLLQTLDDPSSPTNLNALKFTFNYTATDGDGDTSPSTFTTTVTDDTPIGPTGASLAISEHGLVGASDVLVTSTGPVAFVPGADGFAGGSLASAIAFTTLPTGLTVDNGTAVTVAQNGAVVTGSANGAVVFTLTVNADGSYTYEQFVALHHPSSGADIDTLNFGFTITDGDGDVSAPATISVAVTDDTPVTPTGASLSISEHGLVSASDVLVTSTGPVAFAPGADGFFKGSLASAITFTTLPTGLTVDNGTAVTVAQNGAVVTGSANGAVVFTLTVNADGSYTYEQFVALHHPSSGADIDTLNFAFTITDGDGDVSAPATVTVNVTDDVPTISVSGTVVTADETPGVQANDIALISAPAALPTGFINVAQSAAGYAAIAGGADGVKSVTLTDANGAALSGAHSGLFGLDGNEILLTTSATNPNLVLGMEGGHLALALYVDPTTGTVTVAEYEAMRNPVTTDPNDPVSMNNVVFVSVTDGDGDVATSKTALQVTILDDGPTIGAPDSETVQEHTLVVQPAVVDSVSGSLAIDFGTDGPGPAGTPGNPGTLHVFNFNGLSQGGQPTIPEGTFTIKTDDGVVNTGNPEIYGTKITITNGGVPFELSKVDLGLFATSTSTKVDNVTLTGTDIHGQTISDTVNIGSVVQNFGDTLTYTYDMTGGGVFAGVELTSLQIVPVAGTFSDGTLSGADVIIDNLNVVSGAAPAVPGPVAFTDLATAVNNISIADQNGGPVSAQTLTSHGAMVQYELLDSATLVAYTGAAPTSINASNVVFSVVLSQNPTSNPNGGYTFTLDQPLDDLPAAITDLKFSFAFTATDGDGDTIPGHFTVDVHDDTPVTPTGASMTIAEHGLVSAAEITETSTNPVAFAPGADGFAGGSLANAIHFTALPAGFTTDDGTAITVTPNGTTATGKAGSTVVFTLTVNADGSYTYEQFVALHHPSSGADIDTLNFAFTITDGDGDVSAPATVTVNVTDDVPTISVSGTAVTADETPGVQANDIALTSAPTALPTGFINVAQSAAGYAAIAGGADGVKSVTLTDANGAALSGAHSGLFGLDGNEILLTTSATNPNLVLGMEGGHLALALYVDPTTGTVTVAEYEAVRNPVTTDPNDPVSMNSVVFVSVTDGDGDVATSSTALKVTILDDGPTIGAPDSESVQEHTLVVQPAVVDSVSGSLAIDFGTDGPGPAAIPANPGTLHTFNFNGLNGPLTTAQETFGNFVFNASQGAATGTLEGTTITLKNSASPFILTTVDLGLAGHSVNNQNVGPDPAADNVKLVGIDIHGNTITDIVNLGGEIANVGDPLVYTFVAAGTPFAGVELTSLQIEPVLSRNSDGSIFSGSVLIDNLNVLTGAAPAVPGPVAFTDLATAVNNITILDDHNNPVSATTLTSHGLTVQYELLDSATLVAYTLGAGQIVPTSINASNVVFSVVLSQDPVNNPHGGYTFTLDKPLDDLPAAVTDLNFTFKFTATDGDGDTAASHFSVDVHDDVPTLVAQTPVAIIDGNFHGNLNGGTGDFATPGSWSQPLGAIDSKASDSIDNGAWTYSASPVGGATQVQLERVDSGYAGSVSPDGSPMIDLEASPGNIQVSQTINGLTAGEHVLVSFDIGEANFGNAQLEVLWNGSKVGIYNPQNGPMQFESIGVTATGSSGTVTFEEIGIAGDNTGTFLTDVSAMQVAGTVYEAGLNTTVETFTTVSLPPPTGDITVEASSLHVTGTEVGAMNVPPITASGTLAGLVQFGADGPAMNGSTVNGFELVPHSSADAASFVNGLHLSSFGSAVNQATLSGDTLTATAADGHNVFTLTVNGDGTWTFNLLAPLDDSHQGADAITLDFSGLVQAVDFDGDSIGLTPGTFSVAVVDDVPVALKAPDAETVQESGLVSGDPATQAITGFLNVEWGADDGSAKHLNFVTDSNGNYAGPHLTSGGVTLDYIVVTNTEPGGGTEAQLIAYKDGDATHNPVFSVTLDTAPGEANPFYTFTLYQPIDEPGQGADTITLNFNVTATDSDGDTIPLSPISVSIVDDVPHPTIASTGTTLTIDETSGIQLGTDDIGTSHIPAVFSGLGTPIEIAQSSSAVVSAGGTFGADGEAPGAAPVFSLSVSTDGVFSGLTATDGNKIYLYQDGALVLGREGSDTGGNPSGFIAFAVSLDGGTGVASIAEYTAIHQNDPTNPNDSVSMADGVLLASVAYTDGDGDVVKAAPVSIGGQINFLDDGPTIGSAGNLIVNGGFENDIGGLVSGQWSVFHEVTGWTSVDQPGLGDVPFELQDGNISGVPPLPNGANGNIIVELDSDLTSGNLPAGNPNNTNNTTHTNAEIQQVVADTVAGQVYELSFFYSPRPAGGDGDSSSMNVLWNGQIVKSIDSTGLQPGWQQIEIFVEGTGPNNTVAFQATGLQDSWGALIDNVSLLAVTAVGEGGLLIGNGDSVNGNGAHVPGYIALPNTDGDNNDATATGVLNVNWGADSFDAVDQYSVLTGFTEDAGVGRSLTFTNANVAIVGEAGTTLTSHGDLVTFAVSSNGYELVGSATNSLGQTREVIDITLSDDGTGAYHVILKDALDDAAGNGQAPIGLTFNYTATDSDGDSINGNFTVAVTDDIPVLTTHAPISAMVNDSAGSSTAIDLTPLVSVGADSPAAWSLTTFSTAQNVGTLTYQGTQITMTSDGSTITGMAGGTTVFTMTLSTGGQATFDLLHPVDGGLPHSIDFSQFVTVTDHDGDSVNLSTGEFVVNVNATVDLQPSVTAATVSVDEAGLPAHGNLPAGSQNGNNSNVHTDTIAINLGDTPSTIAINGHALGLGTSGEIIQGAFGTLVIDSVSSTSIGYTYTLTTNTGGDTTADVFQVTVKDDDGETSTQPLTINIVDDVPTANPDTASVESGAKVINGNVETNDVAGADGIASIAWTGAVSGSIVTTLGTLTVNPDGTYSYAANANESGTDTFHYTITDGDGDQSSSTLTITVTNGEPMLAAVTGEVNEAGLSTGSNPSVAATQAIGVLNLGDADTPHVTKVSVGEGLNNSAVVGSSGITTIDGLYGNLQIDQNGHYTYTLTTNDPHHTSQGTGSDGQTDTFSYTVTDAFGNTSTSTIAIAIDDDVPTARPDTDSTGTGTIATGNVITGFSTDNPTTGADTKGADGALVSQIVGFNGATDSSADSSHNFEVSGQYGNLVINQDGDYTYTRLATSVNAGSDTFTYTLTDGDGDTSLATLTINLGQQNLLVVGSVADDTSIATALHTVPSPIADQGVVQGQGGNDILVGDPGGATAPVAGQIANFSFVLDNSGSVDDSHLALLESSVDKMLTALAGSHAEDVRVNLVAFNDTATSLGTFDLISNGVENTAQLTAALNAVNTLPSEGNTNYEAGLQQALQFIQGASTTITVNHDSKFDANNLNGNNDTADIIGTSSTQVALVSQWTQPGLTPGSLQSVDGSASGGFNIDGTDQYLRFDFGAFTDFDGSGSGYNNAHNFNGVPVTTATYTLENDNVTLFGGTGGITFTYVVHYTDNTVQTFSDNVSAHGLFSDPNSDTVSLGTVGKTIDYVEFSENNSGGTVDLDSVTSTTNPGTLANANVNQLVFVSDGEPNEAFNSSGNVISVNASTAVSDSASAIAAIESNTAGPLDQTFTIQAFGLNTNPTDLGILSQVEGPGGSATALPSDGSGIATSYAGMIAGMAGTTGGVTAAGSDVINGGAGNDIIFGDVLNTDALAASMGITTLPAGSGWAVFGLLEKDTVAGHTTWTRTDTINYIDSHPFALAAESGRTGGNDVIDGGTGNDLIFGQEGNDTITDTIAAGSRDFIDGGSQPTGGADTLNLNISAATGTVYLETVAEYDARTGTTYHLTGASELAGTDVATSGITDNQVILVSDAAGNISAEIVNIEEIVVTGSANNDTFVVGGDFSTTALLPSTITVNLNGGDDTLDLRQRTSAERVVADGGQGNDTVELNYAYSAITGVVLNGNEVDITHNGITDVFTNFENFQFTDTTQTFAQLAAGPAAPTIASLTDNVALIQGAIGNPGLTNDPTPTAQVSLVGTDALAGETVQLYNGSTALAGASVVLSATDISNGFVTITTPSLNDGSYNLNARITDLFGHTSGASANFVFTEDHTPPAAPSLALGTGVANGATAAEATASGGVVTVTGEAGDTISVTFTNGTHSVIKTLTGTGGAEAVTLTSNDLTTLGDGTIAVSATQTDAAGNVQTAAAATTSFVLDTTPPAAPTLALGAGVANGATAAEATAAGGVVTVTGEAGDTISVTFTNGTHTVNETLTGTGSSQAVTLSSANLTTLGNGTITVSATQTDAAGNPQTAPAATTSFVLDTVAPAAPTLALGAGVANGATAAEATAAGGVVTVTGEAGDTISVTFTHGTHTVNETLTGTGSAQAVTLSSTNLTTLGDGTITVSATQTDAAGNVQTAPAATTSFLLDTTPPAAPTLALGAGVANGATAAEATAAGGVVTVTGEAGDSISVTFTNGTHTVSETLTGTGGAEAVTLTSANLTTLGDGTITVSATQTDAAGNPQTAPAATTSFVLDTTPPAAPTLALGAGVANGATAAEATAAGGVVTVTGEAGDSISVTFTNGTHTVNETLTGTGSAQAVTLSSANLTTLGDGTITVSATQIDAAGNPQTAPAATTSFVLDTVAPTVAITTDDNALKIGDVAHLTFTLSEVSTTFTSSDVTVSGGTLSGFTGSGTTYTANFSPTSNSTTSATVNVGSATFTDAAGNNNTPAPQLTMSVDTIAPTVTSIVMSDTALTVGETSSVTITFSEKVSGFSNTDVTDPNGTLSTLTSSDGGTTWTGTFTPTVGVTSSTDVISVTNASYTDLAGNAGSGGSSANYTVNTANTGAAPLTISDASHAVTTPHVGDVLTANLGADPDGGTNTGHAIIYTWADNGVTVQTGTGDSTYTVKTSDIGHTITVEAQYLDNDTFANDVTSSPTGTVLDNAPAIGTAGLTGSVTEDATGSSASGNLIVNGNFESTFLPFGSGSPAEPTSWTVNGEAFIVTQSTHSGAAALAFASSFFTAGSASQSFATTAGETYTVTFWVENQNAETKFTVDPTFNVSATGGNTVAVNYADDSSFHQFSYTFTATSANSTLSFSARTCGPANCCSTTCR